MQRLVRTLEAKLHWHLACQLMVILLTGGCAGHAINEHQSYPRTMPSLATTPVDGDCPDLSGTYTNDAAETWPGTSPERAPLQSLLTSVYVQGRTANAGTARKAHDIEEAAKPLYDLPAETVRLTLTKGRLEVRYVASDEADATIAFVQGGISIRGPRYTCAKFKEGPGLQLSPFLSNDSFGVPVEVGVFGGSNTAVVLYKSVDGSLVVRLQAESGFTVLLVPYIRTDSEWLRFGTAGQAGTSRQ